MSLVGKESVSCCLVEDQQDNECQAAQHEDEWEGDYGKRGLHRFIFQRSGQIAMSPTAISRNGKANNFSTPFIDDPSLAKSTAVVNNRSVHAR